MRDHEMDGFEDLERALRDELAVTPDPAARARSRARILEATIPARPPRRPLRRRGLVAPLTAAFVVLSATGAAAVPASAHALPGDPLFGVRMATESIRIAIARDEAAVRLSVARARTNDLERAIGKGRERAVAEISRRFFEQLDAVRDLSEGDGAELIAKIEAQQAHLDAIADRIEGQIGERARADEVLRNIRRHDNRGKGSSSPGPHSGAEDDARDDDRGNGKGRGRGGDKDDRDGEDAEDPTRSPDGHAEDRDEDEDPDDDRE